MWTIRQRRYWYPSPGPTVTERESSGSRRRRHGLRHEPEFMRPAGPDLRQGRSRGGCGRDDCRAEQRHRYRGAHADAWVLFLKSSAVQVEFAFHCNLNEWRFSRGLNVLGPAGSGPARLPHACQSARALDLLIEARKRLLLYGIVDEADSQGRPHQSSFTFTITALALPILTEVARGD